MKKEELRIANILRDNITEIEKLLERETILSNKIEQLREALKLVHTGAVRCPHCQRDFTI